MQFPPALQRLFASQPWCLECDGALVQERARWRCLWCGASGTYAHMEHRGRRIRVRVVEQRGDAHA